MPSLPNDSIVMRPGGDFYTIAPGQRVFEKPACLYDTYHFKPGEKIPNPVPFFANSTAQTATQEKIDTNNQSGGKMLISTDWKVWDIEAYLFASVDIFGVDYVNDLNAIKRAKLSFKIAQDIGYESPLHRHLKLPAPQSAVNGQLSLNNQPLKGIITVPKGCQYSIEVEIQQDVKELSKLACSLVVCLVGRTSEPILKPFAY